VAPRLFVRKGVGVGRVKGGGGDESGRLLPAK
jgi:hypothetical protein